MKDNNEISRKTCQDIIEDMKARGFGAILWNNATADFHSIPEILVTDPKGGQKVCRIMGLYRYDDSLYLVEEDAHIKFTDFYNKDTEVPPVVVTLGEDTAKADLGDPAGRRGFTQDGTLEEWLGISDCYFEAIAED